MSNMNAWDDLPNAKYIDLVLADLKKNLGNWVAAHNDYWDAASNAARNDAWASAHNVVRDDVWAIARDKAWVISRDAGKSWTWVISRDAGKTWPAAYNVAIGAILALVAYDDSGWILDEKLEDIRLLTALSQEPQYVLLYPAVLALSKQGEVHE
jgi:hypothetical protein